MTAIVTCSYFARHQETQQEFWIRLLVQGGKKNIMDEGLLSYTRKKGVAVEEEGLDIKKIAEIPFDFERRMVSVVLKGPSSVWPILICKVRHALLIVAAAQQELFVMRRALLCSCEIEALPRGVCNKGNRTWMGCCALITIGLGYLSLNLEGTNPFHKGLKIFDGSASRKGDRRGQCIAH